jgi:ribonuclease D
MTARDGDWSRDEPAPGADDPVRPEIASSTAPQRGDPSLAGEGVVGAADTPAAPGYWGEVAPPIATPVRTTWTFVERADVLARVAATLSSAQVLAIDAEFVQVRVRDPADPPHRLALLQLAALPGQAGAVVVDPLRISDLRHVEALLSDGRLLKLFHGIGADARVLATRGLAARHTLDLEAVSRSIFGQRESGLQTMLLRACGVRLDKSLQRSDWTRRPLTPAMLGYAARDAQMTLILFTWLAAHYPWAVALHEVPADPLTPDVAEWILPFLEGARPQRAEWAVAAAGLAGNLSAQAEALQEALAAVRYPMARARVIRLIADLELVVLAPHLRPLLAAPAAEERAGAARALGRLRDAAAEPELRALVHDPVQDVREAAQAAFDQLAGGQAVKPTRTIGRQTAEATWTVGNPDEGHQEASWQTALRARFADTLATASSDANAGSARSNDATDESER